MCKILILTAHNPKQLASIVTRAWCYFNASGESDGFGACWITEDGKLAYVKSRRPHISKNVPSWVDSFSSSKLLNKPSNGGHLLIHGRKATCGICLDNTHPMLSQCETHALIHNGVVHSDTIKNITSSCDSELLLNAMLEQGLAGLKEITGYFAFGMLSRGRLTVVKDNTASLFHAKTSRGHAFGTTTHACSLVTQEPALPMKDNIAITFDSHARKPIAVDNIQKGVAKPTPQSNLPWPDVDDKPIYGEYKTNTNDYYRKKWSRHHVAATQADILTQ